MNTKIEEVAQNIKELKIQGAVSIALAAANAMEVFIETSKDTTRDEFLRELEKAGEVLKNSRPTAVALPNAINLYIKKVRELEVEPPALQEEALRIGKALVKEITNSVEIIGKFGAALIEDGDTILIHCHSTTLMEVLKETHRQKKRVTVYCTETRPWYQGYSSARELGAYGIDAHLIVDSAVARYMPRVQKVFVGADTITKDLKVINKIGTRGIAILAKQAEVPFYVVTETLKFDSQRTAGHVEIEERPVQEIVDPKRLPKVKIHNPVFDVTDREFVTSVVTERGVEKLEEIGI